MKEQIFRGHSCSMPRTLYGRKNVLSKSTGRSGALLYKPGKHLVGKWKEFIFLHVVTEDKHARWSDSGADRRGVSSFTGLTLFRVSLEHNFGR